MSAVDISDASMDLDALYDPLASDETMLLRRAVRTLFGETVETIDLATEEERDALITDELRTRVRNDQDAVVLLWGPPGCGKSTWVIDRCRKVDDTFTPATLPKRVAFRELQVPDLYDATPRYGACWIDEAVTAGLLSTATFDPTQRLLVELINIIRYRNVVLFVLIPDPADLAKSFRARRADFRFECDPRDGDVVNGRWGRRVTTRKYYLDDGRWLGFDDDKDVGDIGWPDYRTSSDPFARALWNAYYPLKVRYGDTRVEEIREEMLAAVSAKLKARRKKIEEARAA